MEKPRLKTWFHLKDEFSSFKLIPQEHARYLFGDKDISLRHDLLMSLKECAYSEHGYHAIIWGTAGRGKTHMANNLRLTAYEEDLPLELVYVDCPTIRSAKEPLKTFFAALFKSIPPRLVKRFVTKYVEALDANPEWEKRILSELGNDRSIYNAIKDGLVLPNENTIRGILGWLGGEPYNISDISEQAPRQIESGEQMARNVGALGMILLLAEGKNLIILIDEAERIATVQSGEQFWGWLSAFREVFRRSAVGLILFVIAEHEDNIPDILMQNEILSVIGANNIFGSPTFAPTDAESFLRQLLEKMIKKDPVPPSLQSILNETGESLEYYPFTEEAFQEFIQHHSLGGANESKPRELLNNLERAAQRAISLDKKLIDIEVLQKVIQGM